MRPVFARRRNDRPDDSLVAGTTERLTVPPIDASMPAGLVTATFATG